MITVDEVEAVEAVFVSSPLSADLSVSKSDGASDVVPGQSTTYTISVRTMARMMLPMQLPGLYSQHL